MRKQGGSAEESRGGGPSSTADKKAPAATHARQPPVAPHTHQQVRLLLCGHEEHSGAHGKQQEAVCVRQMRAIDRVEVAGGGQRIGSFSISRPSSSRSLPFPLPPPPAHAQALTFLPKHHARRGPSLFPRAGVRNACDPSPLCDRGAVRAILWRRRRLWPLCVNAQHGQGQCAAAGRAPVPRRRRGAR